jgi:hypothetical protein
MSASDLDIPPSGLRRGPVILRRFVENDQAALMRAIRDPLIEHYMLTQATPTEADRHDWADSLLGAWQPSTARLAIAEDGRPHRSGEISVHLVRHLRSSEVGYW